MRTIKVNVYNFKELSDEAKARAIDDMQYRMIEGESDEALRWAIDDCSLLEPSHLEMVELLGENYYDRNLTPDGKYGQFVFKNLRKGIQVDLDGENLWIADALEITNHEMFLTWLGFPKELHEHVDYLVKDGGVNTYIEFDHINIEEDDPRFSTLTSYFRQAEEKFSEHMDEILYRINVGFREYFSDENIIERLSDLEFTEYGTIY